ncbi:MAG TPA: hypothetical protein VF444_01940 [Pseudonocardiaceae bacterium]
MTGADSLRAVDGYLPELCAAIGVAALGAESVARIAEPSAPRDFTAGQLVFAICACLQVLPVLMVGVPVQGLSIARIVSGRKTAVQVADTHHQTVILRDNLTLSSRSLSADPARNYVPSQTDEESLAMPAVDLSGIWHSRYVYASTGRNEEFTSEHYLVLRQHGERLIGQSLPNNSGSRLRLELTLDIPVATGTWREITSPTGYYKGASTTAPFSSSSTPTDAACAECGSASVEISSSTAETGSSPGRTIPPARTRNAPTT